MSANVSANELRNFVVVGMFVRAWVRFVAIEVVESLLVLRR